MSDAAPGRRDGLLRAGFAPSADYARLVWPLSAAQLVSWGSFYYGFTLFLAPMEAELGWDRAELTQALTLGLLVAGACSLSFGRLVDRGHARALMTGGSLLGAAMLAAWSVVASPAQFLAIWTGLGVALAATLYEPAFAVLVRSLGALSRRAVAAMTLVGGFASTLFIPLTHLLIEAFGWRDALLVLAAINVVGGALVHAVALRGQAAPRGGGGDGAAASSRISAVAAFRRPAFWWLLAAFTASFVTIASVTFHVVPMLAERGFTTAEAVAAVALFGPAQVAGRVVVTMVFPSISVFVSGVAALGLPVLGLAIVLVGPQAFATIAAFAVCLGAGNGNGIVTIVRAHAVAEITADNGTINLPVSAARALAPSAATLLWAAAGGYDAVLWCLVGVSLFAVAAFATGISRGR